MGKHAGIGGIGRRPGRLPRREQRRDRRRDAPPIPWADLEGPCQTSILWKDAESALKGHVEHLVVTVLSDANPVDQSVLLTQVCASVLATCPQAPGVYWGPATLVVPSKLFQDFAAEVLPDGPPLPIWVDVRVGPTESGRTAGFTTGMKALGHMEIETQDSPESPGHLRERLYDLAGYVVQNGPVIKDGDTVGQDAKEKIRVVYGKSAFGHEGEIMRLEYGGTQRKSWFRW